MTQSTLRASACALLSLAASACSTESSPALRQCPASGIAAAHLAKYPDPKSIGDCSGGPCMWDPSQICDASDGCSEIREYRQYACSEPQICPDVGGPDPVLLRINQPTTLNILITNCSTGTQPLVISQVQILGDTRCAFSAITDQQIGDKIIPPGQTTAITTVYTPQLDADDHAEIRILSNARNAPALHILACGTVRPPDAGSMRPPDGGSADARSPYGTKEPDAGPRLDTREILLDPRQCRPQTEIAPCHQK